MLAQRIRDEGDAHGRDARRDATTARIDADLQRGVINLDEALVYKATALLRYDLLPDDYRAGLGHCGTAVAAEIFADLPKASPETQSYIHYLFASPDERRRMPAPHARSDAAAKLIAKPLLIPDASVDTTHFTIWYYTSGANAVSPAYLTEVGIAFEQSYAFEVDAHGFPAPVAPLGFKINVFIGDPSTITGSDAYGIAIPATILTPPSIRIRADYSVFTYPNNDPDPLLGRMRVTAAHELFHLIQFEEIGALKVALNSLWAEGSASAMEDEVFDGVDDYVQYVNSSTGFMNNVDKAISEQDYSSVLFHKLMIEHYGGSPWILHEVMQQIKIIGGATQAIGDTLPSYSSDWDEAMHEFSIWNFFAGPRTPGRYRDAALYNGPKFRPPHILSSSVPTVPAQVLYVNPLAAEYIQLRPDPSLTTQRTLTVKVTTGDTGHVRGWVIIRRTNNTTEIRDCNFSTLVNEAEVVVNDFQAGVVGEVAIVLSNGHTGQPAHFASYEATIKKRIDLAFVIDTTGSMWDDLAVAQSTGQQMVSTLANNGADFKIAVTEFKDFPVSPYGGGGDYAYNSVTPFTDSPASIVGGLYSLSASGGGDWPEAQYSGIMGAINGAGIGTWRNGAKKSIVVMTDAPPHDPEPFTGYTGASVAAAANASGIGIAKRARADAVQTAAANGIHIYTIVIGGDFEALSYATALANATGGKVFTAFNASDVAAALLAAIGEASGGSEPPPPPPPANHPPAVGGATASPSMLWPADNKLVPINILNVSDPDGDAVTLTVTGITQDEPVSGKKEPDGTGVGTSSASVRASRDGSGDSRVYRIAFTASDGRGGSANGSITVCVPHDQGVNVPCHDDGQLYDSTKIKP